MFLLNKIDKYFNEFRKTHNQGVFDAYTKDIRAARHVGLLTGLPDAYGRGRIIGDYRRIALYGIDYLMECKKNDWDNMVIDVMDDETMRLREEISMQYRALDQIKKMAAKYGCDISKPAQNSKEAVQWTYFGYLAAIKENNGAAMSLGRVDAFFDIYFNRDLENGTITEEEVQELIDQFVIKLRLARHLRTPEYDELFSGDPTWVTSSMAGMLDEEKSLVTKTDYYVAVLPGTKANFAVKINDYVVKSAASVTIERSYIVKMALPYNVYLHAKTTKYDWTADGARFATWTWGTGVTDSWFDLVAEGHEGVY